MKALGQGVTTFDYQLSDEFFASLEDAEIQRGSLVCQVSVRRTGDVFDLDFHTEGHVYVPCDVCLDDMEQPIATDNHLVAKFGSEHTEDDDLVTVAEDEGILDVAWYIYESIALAVPVRHVHAPGSCNAAMIDVLDRLAPQPAASAARSGEESDDEAVDPRWAALAKLKDNK